MASRWRVLAWMAALANTEVLRQGYLAELITWGAFGPRPQDVPRA